MRTRSLNEWHRQAEALAGRVADEIRRRLGYRTVYVEANTGRVVVRFTTMMSKLVLEHSGEGYAYLHYLRNDEDLELLRIFEEALKKALGAGLIERAEITADERPHHTYPEVARKAGLAFNPRPFFPYWNKTVTLGGEAT